MGILFGSNKKKEIDEENEETKEKIFENGIIFEMNDSSKKKDKFIFAFENNDMFLGKKDDINDDNYNVKIKELFKEESNDGEDIYYINKEKIKEKYLNQLLIPESDDIIKPEDPEEMTRLYQEKTSSHPKEYSFCSWSGFFCFGECPSLEKSGLLKLGYAISSYFKTLKLFILFFFVISGINLISVFHYLKYTSIYENKNMLLKTTLSNTRITKYNSVVFTYNSSELIDQDNIILNCFNCSIGKFIYGLKNNEINEDEIGLLHNFSLLEQYEIKKPESLSPKWDEINRNKLNEYNEELIKVLNDNKTIINKNIFFDSNVKSKYQSKILYYECIDKSKLPKNTHENSLKKIIHGTTIVTLLLLIILYYYYSFNFNIDQNAYFSNIKIFKVLH